MIAIKMKDTTPVVVINEKETEVQAVLVCYYGNNKDTMGVRLWKEKMFSGDMQQFVLDIINSVKYLASQLVPNESEVDAVILKNTESFFDNIRKQAEEYFKNSIKTRKTLENEYKESGKAETSSRSLEAE